MRQFAIVLAALLISACGGKKESENTYMNHEYVDLGLSVKWATCNIGARNPEDAGNYYAWGELTPKESYTWRNYRFYKSGKDILDIVINKYDVDEKKPEPFTYKKSLDVADDVAKAEWGGEWRMPTKTEIDELYMKCEWTWTTLNDVVGIKITSKVEGYTDRSIFMPASGQFNKRNLEVEGMYGRTWSSSNAPYNGRAYALDFEKRGSRMDVNAISLADELLYWNNTDEECYDYLSDTLEAQFRALFATGNVDINHIPQPLFDEFKDYLSHMDWDMAAYFDCSLGLPVRPVW